jgi:hypothetical protein
VTDGDSLRFVPGDAGFERRSGLVDSLLAHWTIVAGTGPWLDAHLLARLGRALGWPNLRGCGISEQEVLQLATYLSCPRWHPSSSGHSYRSPNLIGVAVMFRTTTPSTTPSRR